MANILDMLKDFLSGSNQAKTTNTKPYDRDKRTYTQSTKASNDVARKQPQIQKQKEEQKLYADTDFSKGLTGHSKAKADYNANLYTQKGNKFNPNDFKQEDIYNLDGTRKDYTEDIAKLEKDARIYGRVVGTKDGAKVYDEAKLNETNKLLDKLTKHQEYIDYLNGVDYINNPETTLEDANKFLELQSHTDDRLDERLANIVGKTATGIANIAPQAYDLAKEFASEYSADLIESEKQQFLDYGWTEEQFNDYVKSRRDLVNPLDEDNWSQKLKGIQDEYNQFIYQGTDGIEQFGLQAIDSTANFGAHYMMAMATGGSSLVSMGLQSGAEKAMQNLRDGYDIETATLNGALTGALTMLTEKLPTENFTKMITSPLGQFAISGLVTQMASEGLEEGIEYLVEPQIDKLTMGRDVEYSRGELFTAVALGMASGGALGGAGLAINNIRTAREANLMEQDLKTMIQYRDSGQLSPEETNVVNNTIQTYLNALNSFKNNSVLGNAVKFEKDQVKPISAREVQMKMNQMLQPAVDMENAQVQQTREAYEDLQKRAQKLLSSRGINMKADQYFNLDENTRKEVDKVQGYANDLGVKVNFDSFLADSKGNFVDGVFNPKTRAIELRPESKIGMVSTFVHELTHGNESSKYYKPLRDFAQQYIEKINQGKVVRDENGKVIKEYGKGFDEYVRYLSENSYKGETEETILQEATAIAIQENLGNEDFVKELVNYNTSLATRIFEEVKRLASGGDKYSQDIEYNFKKAFADKAKTQKEGKQFLFAGVKAIGVNQEALEVAKQMEEDNFSNQEIWRKTGFVKKADGKWRFEIEDDLSKIHLRPFNYQMHRNGVVGQTTLSEVYDNPELYKAYPALKELPIVDDYDEYDSVMGYFDGKRVVINRAYHENQQKSTLLHEVQHAIQEIENFTKGSSQRREAEVVFKEHLKNVSEYQELLKQYPDLSDDIDEFNSYDWNSEESDYLYNVFNEKYDNDFMSYASLKDSIDSFDIDERAFERYQMNLGEIEARDVQDRARTKTKQLPATFGLVDSNSSFNEISYSITNAKGLVYNKNIKRVKIPYKKQSQLRSVLNTDFKMTTKGLNLITFAGKNENYLVYVNGFDDYYFYSKLTDKQVKDYGLFEGEPSELYGRVTDGDISRIGKPRNGETLGSNNEPTSRRNPTLQRSDEIPSKHSKKGNFFGRSVEQGDRNNKKFSKGESIDSEGRQLTPQQQEYFKNSQMRDDEGNLKVMYRGGNEDITTFDRRKSRSSNLFGRGFYFTESKSHAEQYGKATPYYLNITNPLGDEHTITEDEVLNLLNALYEDEDYGLDNYGYGATPESVLEQVYSEDKSDFEILRDIDLTAVGDLVATTEMFNELNGTTFDGFIRPTETIVFNSNQIKSLDNVKPTSNPDIRYSKGEGIANNEETGNNKEKVEQDEFTRLQEESRRIANSTNWQDRSLENNEDLRRRLPRILQGELERRSIGGRSDARTLNLKSNDSTFKMHENVDGQTFKDMFEIARTFTKNGELVDLHNAETTEDGIGYNDCYNYVSDDGLSGFSITPDGDLISVYNLAKDVIGKKGFLRAIAPIIQEKAVTLDCFASENQNLMAMYEKIFGFKVASIMDYNMEYDHDDIAKNHNMPQVAFMVKTDRDIETKHFNKDQYDEALEYRNSIVEQDKGLQKHDQAVKDYGAFEQGENPVRDVEIAQETDNGKTNRFARTIAESGSVDDNQVELLKGKIGEGDFSYTPVSNNELIENANFKFDKLGVDEMYNSFMESDDLTSQNIANGEILLHNLASVKDNQKAMSVASKLAHMLTEAGRVVQSARILKKLTPEGQLMHLERTIKSIQKTINQRFGNKAPTIKVSEELKNKLLNSANEQEMNQTLEEISVEIAKQIPSTLMDKINAWRYLAMLGNPRTHIRNMAGNAIFYPMVTIKNSIGTIIESVVAKNKGLETRTKAFINKNNADDAKLIQIAESQYDEYKKQLDGKGRYDLKDLVGKNQEIFNSKLLNQASKLNSEAMQKEDVFFSRKRFIQTLASYMKANGMTEADVDSPKMIKAVEYAREESLKQTYQNYNKIANWIDSGRKVKGLKLALDALMPFTKTPMNVVARGIDYSPLGLMKAVTYDAIQLKEGKITANQMIDNLSAGLTGTGVAMLGYIFSMMGWFRTKDEDKDRKGYYDSDLGEQDYALVFPWGTYTIDWASPAIMPFAIGAELFSNAGAFTDGEQIIDIASKIVEPMFETSMLSGLQDSMSSYSKGAKGWFNMFQQMGTNYISQFIPTLFGQIARTIDDTRRTTYPNKGAIDKTIKQVVNKTPFLSMTGEAYINRHGEEEKQEDLGMGMMGRLLLNTLSPGYYKSNKVTEYDEELYRLYKETGDTGVIPSNSTTKLTYEGEEYKLFDEEFTKYQKGRYELENKYVNAFIDSDVYDNYTDAERSKIIGKMREFAGMHQKDEYLQSIGKANLDDEYLNIEDALNNDLELHEYFIAKDYLNNIKGDNAKSQYIDFLNEGNYSMKAKNYLYDVKYGDSKFNNHIESIQEEYGLTDEQALKMKFTSDVEGVRKEDGSLVANSKALEVRQKYEELGTYDDVLDYIKANGLQPKDVGLSKSVLNMSQGQFKSKYMEMFSGKNYSQNEENAPSTKYSKNDTDKIAKAIAQSSGTPKETYKKLNDILDEYVNGKSTEEVKKNIQKIRKKYIDAGLKDLIDKYLKDNPYADKSMFGL